MRKRSFIWQVLAFSVAVSLLMVSAVFAEDYAKAARKDTVIFDIDGGRVVTPDLWNPYVPGNRRDHGYHQAMIEPFFILNYESGEIEPWLAESMD